MSFYRVRFKTGGVVAQLPTPLVIVIQGDSVVQGNGTHEPATRLASLRPAATVSDESVGGTTIIDGTANIATQLTPHRDAAHPTQNYALWLGEANYIDDVRGESGFGGDGSTLTNPNGVAADAYALALSWRTGVRNAGFKAVYCCPPAWVENTANPFSNNANYYNPCRAALRSLILANAGQFDLVIDVWADSAFQDPNNNTYFNGGIHLTDPTGNNRLGDDLHAGLPT